MAHRPRISLFREFLYRFLPLAAVLAAVGTLFFFAQYRAHMKEVRQAQEALVEREQRILQADLGAYLADAMFIASITSNDPGLLRQDREALEHLEQTYLTFAQHKPVFDQVRLLDPSGQELIRIQQGPLGYEVLPRAMLQNKAERYYFTDALDLMSGQVALSRFDLNMEHGAVEIPRKPMLRFSTPVISRNGDLLGVVVLNFLGDRLLERIRQAGNSASCRIRLLDQEGYWLVGPDKDQEWGFMFEDGQDKTLRSMQPELWDRIEKDYQGQFLLDGELYSFAWAEPAGDRYSPAAGLSLQRVQERWCILSRLQRSDLWPDWVPLFNMMGLLSLLLAGLLSLFWAQARVSRAWAQQELALSEQRFRDVVDAVSEFIFEMDTQCRFTFLTHDVAQVFGAQPQDLLGSTPLDKAVQSSPQEMQQLAEAMASSDGFNAVEFRIRSGNGSTAWVSLSATPMRDEQDRFTGFRGAGMDITRRKLAEEQVREREETIRAMSRASADAIVMVDQNGLVHFWNPAAMRIFGYTEQEALGRRVHELVSTEQDLEKALHGLKGFAASGTGALMNRTVEVQGRNKNGDLLPVELTINSFRLAGQWHAVAVARDITKRLENRRKLEHLATTDPLTGLANRRHFMERAQVELERCRRYKRPLSLIMFDLDHFKSVNDTYGHDVGDQVLRMVAAKTGDTLREVDVLGRMGGEEFAALLPETDAESAMDVAERLRLTVEQASVAVPDAPDGLLRITMSLGVTCHLQDILPSLEEMLKQADMALYRAKESGRNQVACSIQE